MNNSERALMAAVGGRRDALSTRYESVHALLTKLFDNTMKFEQRYSLRLCINWLRVLPIEIAIEFTIPCLSPFESILCFYNGEM